MRKVSAHAVCLGAPQTLVLDIQMLSVDRCASHLYVSYDGGCFIDSGKRLLLHPPVSRSHDVMKKGPKSLLFKASASRI